MAQNKDESKSELIEKVIHEINHKIPKDKAAPIVQLTKQLYETVSFEDLQSRSVNDLYGIIFSLWRLLERRKENEVDISVYNPNDAQHGWQSTHTIVQVNMKDMPFLVDSIRMELDRLGYTIHLIIHTGSVKIKCDEKGLVTKLLPQHTPENKLERIYSEAVIYLEIDRQTDQATLDQIQKNIARVLRDVRVSVEDWELMRAGVRNALQELEKVKAHLDPDELAESRDFLRWIEDNHFTFLGMRDYELIQENDEYILRVLPETGLGVLRDSSKSRVSRHLTEMTPEARKLTLSSQILIISKTNTLSTVHRPAYTDYIGVKRFDKNGTVIGERRIIGLYTSAAYNTNPKHIPFLRRKVALVMENSKMTHNSHAYKTLLNILETLPRDDLFQSTADELLESALGIFHMQERRRIRLFVRKDIYSRFISALVYVPRDRFNTELRQEMEKIFTKAFKALEINFSTRFSESVLARIHFIIRIDPHQPLEYDVKEIEQDLVEISRIWQDVLAEQLIEYYGEERGNKLINLYLHAFPASYREDFPSRFAVYDIKHIESLSEDNRLEMNFFRSMDDVNGKIRLKIFQLDQTIPLSDVLPILEHMGLRVLSEQPYDLHLSNGRTAWINDFGMSYCDYSMLQCDVKELDIDAVKEIFQEAFSSVWFGLAENDNFNRLVLGANLNWREVAILRAYAKYLRQIKFTFSQSYMEHALTAHPTIVAKLVHLFKMRFDPHYPRSAELSVDGLIEKIFQEIDQVTSLDDDRILRKYLELIMATTRTNYFQKNEKGSHKSYISLKFNPQKIGDLPLPRPMFEVFVYSPRFEGVHLRGGKVARGGLRWSDRPEDFRTEVLGLMKAQQVKNAIIVPAGAKGGFVPKIIPPDASRDVIFEIGISCYQDFIRGLLDITDNIKNDVIIPPENVIRYDEDDHYLVVAADKGTATFSDIANAIAEERGFWLGDAFASGGSTGYDHKKMGITARGAWESVKRHFRQLNRDIQQEDFTVVGIGDMAGDVFGNGMLLSRHIKLIGAFNHMHIFLDPDPDPTVSFEERERLFNLPRSSWEDYDRKKISEGGGIYPRSIKSIPLSSQVQKALGINASSLEPNEIIRAMLKAPVDLLWNGGIGTFVKGEHQTHLDVGDKASDLIRVNASELRCKVVGEGGNLGFTQEARVEYALNGGLIYADFIDNSGGVDCSDHEVNIKILLNKVVERGDMTVKQRNALLVEMTNEVAELVLSNNYHQTQAISLAASQALRNIELHGRYIQYLEDTKQIHRSFEVLPDEKTLMDRKSIGKGLTRPGISVLFAYTKNILKQNILDSDVPEDRYLSRVLQIEFPQPLHEKFKEEMQHHTLRREIIATQLANLLVNEMSFTFAYRLYDETGASVPEIVRAYAVARTVLDIHNLWGEIESLDYKVPAALQIDMMIKASRVARRASRWLLRHMRMALDIGATVEHFKEDVLKLYETLPKVLAGTDKEYFEKIYQEYTSQGVEENLAHRMAVMGTMFGALDIVNGAKMHGFALEKFAEVYFVLGEYLDIGWLREQILLHPTENYWEALSRESIRDELDWQQRQISIGILLDDASGASAKVILENWAEKYHPILARWKKMLENLRSSSVLTFTMFFAATRELLDISQACFQNVAINNNGQSNVMKNFSTAKSNETLISHEEKS